METRELSYREVQVLDIIVRNYILSASPTGSRFIAKQPGFNLSPATIRNVMGDLEEMGFITHPHTSAGRVPTDKGYRYYVDSLMQSVRLGENVKRQIRDTIRQSDPSDLRVLMEATSCALSRATRQLGIILAPRLRNGIFRHLYIHEIAPNKILLSLTIDSGFIRNMVIEIETEIQHQGLEAACDIINERFGGMTLEEMSEAGERVFTDIETYTLGVIRLFVPSIKRMIADDQYEEVYTEGETNILMQPEFFNKEKAEAVIEILEEKRLLMHIVDTGVEPKGRVVVTIGGEIEKGEFSSFGIVKTKYQIGNMEGSLGIIGPKRMPYPFLVSAVDYTAKTLCEIYSR